jgi:hypothetical protein
MEKLNKTPDPNFMLRGQIIFYTIVNSNKKI